MIINDSLISQQNKMFFIYQKDSVPGRNVDVSWTNLLHSHEELKAAACTHYSVAMHIVCQDTWWWAALSLHPSHRADPQTLMTALRLALGVGGWHGLDLISLGHRFLLGGLLTSLGTEKRAGHDLESLTCVWTLRHHSLYEEKPDTVAQNLHGSL